ncbi:MAG: hypothetical protein ACKO63_17035 [Nodosilinea sp.]
MENISVRENFQIDNVQDFVKAAGNNNIFWKLLVNKKISRFNKEVRYRIEHWSRQEERGIKYFESGRVFSIKNQESLGLIIEVDYGNEFRVKYTKEKFVEQFNTIFLPIPFQKIIEPTFRRLLLVSRCVFNFRLLKPLKPRWLRFEIQDQPEFRNIKHGTRRGIYSNPEILFEYTSQLLPLSIHIGNILSTCGM